MLFSNGGQHCLFEGDVIMGKMEYRGGAHTLEHAHDGQQLNSAKFQTGNQLNGATLLPGEMQKILGHRLPSDDPEGCR